MNFPLPLTSLSSYIVSIAFAHNILGGLLLWFEGSGFYLCGDFAETRAEEQKR
jgi:hypothetical protein